MRFLFAIILITIGIFIGLYLHEFLQISFDYKINIVELLTLLFTVFIALYVPAFLDRKLLNNRYKKETIIRKIESLQQLIKEINKLVTESSTKISVSRSCSSKILGNFTSISNELWSLKKLVNYSFKNKFITKVESIIKLRGEYKDIVTGGNFGDNKFKYTGLAKKEEEQKYLEIDDMLSSLIIEVNDL